ncbi:MAG: ComEC/Rec2 family competence protein [Isosphaeraceae bacterium]
MQREMDERPESLAGRGDVGGIMIEVNLFACGHGDTVLVRLPGPKWVLIDCHLPKHNGVYSRFLHFLDQQAKKEGLSCFGRLDWVILTHPDEDHYLGMASLLEHFTREDRSVGSWLSSGLSAHQFRALAWPDSQTKRGYRQLLNCVRRLAAEKLLRRQILHEDCNAISPFGYKGRVELFPIAPSAETLFSRAESDLPRAGKEQNFRIEANPLSIVLVLSVTEHGKSCNFLLAGDAGPEQLEEAIRIWHRRAEEYGRDKIIYVIKVPHHGSLDSHWSALAKQEVDDDRIAAISAGTRSKLPDREVLRDYLINGWRVLVTARRVPKPAPRERPMALSDRSRFVVATRHETTQYDVSIRWQPTHGITYHPHEASIEAADLTLYDTAAAEPHQHSE